jgi:DNA processing protein
MLLTDAEEIVEIMGWEEKAKSLKDLPDGKAGRKSQREIFIELSKEEKIIVEILKEKETVHIDEINIRSGLSSSSVAAAILSLELQGVVATLPGKMYKLN